jgi:hypothetical protein
MCLAIIPARRAEQAAARAALAGVDGPVLAEQTFWAAGAGRAPLVVPFLTTQLAAAGRWDPAPLVEAIERGTVERALLGFPLDADVANDRLSFHAERFPGAVLAALRARYVLERRADGVDLWVYRPRDGG